MSLGRKLKGYQEISSITLWFNGTFSFHICVCYWIYIEFYVDVYVLQWWLLLVVEVCENDTWELLYLD